MQIQVPANKLAEFITAKTPERRKQLVRQLKHGGGSHPVYYTLFHGVAKRFLIGGANDAIEILHLIERLKSRTQSEWYARDSRITAEALRAFIKIAPRLHDLKVVFVPPGENSKAKLKFPDVDVAVTPNLLVHGERKGRPLVGALRFYIAKESAYELGKRGAELVAVMEHQWLTRLATGARTPDAELCMVLECFQQRVTAAPGDTAAQLAIIERGCREFAHLWHLIDDKAA